MDIVKPLMKRATKKHTEKRCRVATPLVKSWNSFCKILRTWKVLENGIGSGKSEKFKLKVLENPGDLLGHRHNDAEVDRRKNIHICTPLVFVIHSYSDKTFFFTTCDSDEHCSMDATVTLLYVE